MSLYVIDAINSVLNQIEGIFNTAEVHKCYYKEVMILCDIETEDCKNTIKGINILCNYCIKKLNVQKEGIYSNHKETVAYSYATSNQLKNRHTHLDKKKDCILASCRKIHENS
jgi:hypothetical protein